MNKSQLIEKLAMKEDLTLKDATSIVDMVFGFMAETLVRNGRVEIRGFGSFKVKEYDSYQGRHPKTGEVIHVASKKLPCFTVGKELKKRVLKKGYR